MTENNEEAGQTLPVANKAPDGSVDTVLALAQRRDLHLVVEVLRVHERGYPLHELTSAASGAEQVRWHKPSWIEEKMRGSNA